MWKIFAIICFAASPAFAQTSSPYLTKAWATLGDPEASPPGTSYYVPDTPSGPSLMVDDGNSWDVLASNVNVQSYVLTEDDNGLHTFIYPFAATPSVEVTLEDNSSVGGLRYDVISKTTTSITIRVSRGSKPPLLTMSKFVPFTGGDTSGVKINLVAGAVTVG